MSALLSIVLQNTYGVAEDNFPGCGRGDRIIVPGGPQQNRRKKSACSAPLWSVALRCLKENFATHPDELPEPSAITEPLLLDRSCLDVTESDPRHRVG